MGTPLTVLVLANPIAGAGASDAFVCACCASRKSRRETQRHVVSRTCARHDAIRSRVEALPEQLRELLRAIANEHAHVTLVAVSAILFAGRGVAQMMGINWRRARALKIAPHVIDTLLLVTAVALCFVIAQAPIAQSWLTAKVVGLVAYIGLGMAALRPTATKTRQAVFFVLALACLGYIVAVAFAKSPWPF